MWLFTVLLVMVVFLRLYFAIVMRCTQIILSGTHTLWFMLATNNARRRVKRERVRNFQSYSHYLIQSFVENSDEFQCYFGIWYVSMNYTSLFDNSFPLDKSISERDILNEQFSAFVCVQTRFSGLSFLHLFIHQKRMYERRHGNGMRWKYYIENCHSMFIMWFGAFLFAQCCLLAIVHFKIVW